MGHKGSGCRAENQDRVLHRIVSADDADVLVLAVADGVSRCPHGAEIASWLIEKHLANDELFETAGGRHAIEFRKYLRQLNERFYQEFNDDLPMIESACTLSVALLEKNAAHCVWVGDSPIYLARKYEEQFDVEQISVPDSVGRLLVDCFGAHAPFHVKHRKIDLRIGDVIVVASDGVAHIPEELEHHLNAHGPTEALLQAIEESAKEHEFYDDASLVLAQRLH